MCRTGVATKLLHSIMHAGGQSRVDSLASSQCPLWVKSGHGNQLAQCPLYPRKRTSEPARVLPSAHELRQLGDIGRNPPRLIFRQQLGRRSPAEDRTARPLPESSRTNADDWLPTGSLGRV